MALSDTVSRLIDTAKRLREIADKLNDVESKSQIVDELFALQELREDSQNQNGEGAKVELREPEKKATLPQVSEQINRLEPSADGETYTISLGSEDSIALKDVDPDEEAAIGVAAQLNEAEHAFGAAESNEDVESEKKQEENSEAVKQEPEAANQEPETEKKEAEAEKKEVEELSSKITVIEPPKPTLNEEGQLEVETFSLKSETESELATADDTVVEKAKSKKKKKSKDDDEVIEIAEDEVEVIEDDVEVIEDDVEVIEDDVEIIDESEVEVIEDEADTKKRRAKKAEMRIHELEPLQQAALKKVNDILSPEQVKKKVIATKAAKKAGKTGKELQQYVMAYLELSDEQKDEMAAARKELHQIRQAIAAEVEHLLDDSQKERLRIKR